MLTLYSRDYCHLCHDMLAALEELRGEAGEFPDGFDISVVDVDADPALVARYDEFVPVLVAEKAADGLAGELCHYHLDVVAVRAYLSEFR